MIIETQESLNQLCDRLSKGRYVSLDTEFLRDKTYFPKLCLLQMASPGVEAAAIDPIGTTLDWSPVKALMDNPNVLKVFHAARQDLEIFFNLYGVLPAPLYDTQVAAMVCGFGDQVAYGALVRELTGRELEKNAQFTDWSRRPLSPRQIRYALDDVVYLCDVFEKLESRLNEKGRAYWVQEEMAILSAPQTYQNDPEQAWRRIRIRSDRGDVLTILKFLAAWREREAVARDIPRGRILKDETLGDIAMYKPRDLDSLLQIRSLPHDVAKGKLGPQILAIVKDALDLPRAQWVQPERRDLFPKQAQGTLEMLKMLLKINCAEADVAAKLVADSDDLERLAIEDSPTIPALSGWRYDLFGDDALALKSGALGLKLDKGRIKKIRF